MNKFRAVVKREYLQSVRTKSFVVSVVVGPLFMLLLMVAPALLMQLQTGGATRVAVVDQTGRLYERVRDAITGTQEERDEENAGASGVNAAQARRARRALETRFLIEQVSTAGRAAGEVLDELNGRALRKELDAYVILPPDVLENGRAEFYARNLGDMITAGQLRSRLSRAVVEQRMIDARIDQARVRELSRGVRLTRHKIKEGGAAKGEGEGSFFLALGAASFIVISLLMYGQAMLSAVVEEKTTRLGEVLFSSVRPFTLMAGKLIGVALVALTQYAIWALIFGLFALYGVGALISSGMDVALPGLAPSFALYALLFYLIGFFLYQSIYILVGAMVTTEKEATQIIMPVGMLLAFAIYLSFPIIRNPDSSYSFWLSLIPFFSPVTMLVRIVTETPPFWQIALSLLVGAGAVVVMTWLAARVYRVGMLMYGKRASLPELLRWVRQA